MENAPNVTEQEVKRVAALRVGLFFDRVNAGEAKFAAHEARWLAKLGCDPIVVILRRDESAEKLLRDFGRLDPKIPVYFISDYTRLLPDLRLPFFHFFSLFHLTAPFCAPKVFPPLDVVLANGTYTAFTAITLKRLRGIPFVALIHDPISYILPRVYRKKLYWAFPILIPLGRWLDRIICIEASAVATGSRLHAGLFKSLLPTNKSLHIVYPGCIPQSAERLPSNRGDFVLFASRWESGKYPHFILNLAMMIPRCRIVVAGRWSQPYVLRKLQVEARVRGLSEWIEFTGAVDEDRLDELFRQARCYIHPIRDGYGMGAAEAASWGCPVIVPHGGGVTDVITEAFTYPEGDVTVVSKIVAELFANERLAYEKGMACWRQVQDVSWEAHTRRLLTLLHAAVGK